MADGTKIEWTDATVNAVNGCSVVSPGCTNCYAMRLAGTRLRNHPSRAGLTKPSKAGPVWTGEVRLHEPALRQPLHWRRPRRIFWNAHGDLFHPAVPWEWIVRVFAVCALTPQHSHQILTKRSDRMRKELSRSDFQAEVLDAASHMAASRDALTAAHTAPWPLPNVWLGVSAENQVRADERIPHLLATLAAVRFVSAEPLLGPLNLRPLRVRDDKYGEDRAASIYALDGSYQIPDCHFSEPHPKLDWIIAGGESGPGARPMHPDWARCLRDQCAAAGVPFHFKQWGEFRPYDWATDDYTKNDPTGEYGENGARHILNEGEQPGPENIVIRVGKKAAGRLLDGVEHNGFPIPARGNIDRSEG